jgi:hypothetical protein
VDLQIERNYVDMEEAKKQKIRDAILNNKSGFTSLMHNNFSSTISQSTFEKSREFQKTARVLLKTFRHDYDNRYKAPRI